MAPWGYHAGNLLLHAANAVVFYVVARRLLAAGTGGARTAARVDVGRGGGGGGVRGASAAGGVGGVGDGAAGRAERAVFPAGGAGAISRRWSRGGRGRLDGRWRAVSLGLFAAALMSKASTMMLPAALLVLDVYPLRRRRQGVGWGALVREKLGYFVLAGVGAVVALVAVRQGAR